MTDEMGYKGFMPELPNENTDSIVLKIADQLGAEIPPFGVGLSHIVGKKVGNKPRAIIAKCIGHNLKVELLKNKNKREHIKDSDICQGSSEIFINRDLTSTRARRAKQIRKDKK